MQSNMMLLSLTFSLWADGHGALCCLYSSLRISCPFLQDGLIPIVLLCCYDNSATDVDESPCAPPSLSFPLSFTLDFFSSSYSFFFSPFLLVIRLVHSATLFKLFNSCSCFRVGHFVCKHI